MLPAPTDYGTTTALVLRLKQGYLGHGARLFVVTDGIRVAVAQLPIGIAFAIHLVVAVWLRIN